MRHAELLIVDDEPDLVDVLAESLSELGYTIHKAASVDEAKESLIAESFNLIICDIALGENRRGGLEVLSAAGGKSTPVILISGNADYDILKLAINDGVRFFLEKPFDLQVLKKFVDEALSSNSQLISRMERFANEKDLTAREREVFGLLAKGLSNKEIAESLGTSERTIKAHLSSIFKKFNVDSRAEVLSILLAHS
jgi:DNA-binding NarL/FixJ family response regulator